MSADRQDMVVSHGGIHQGKPQQVLKDQKKKKTCENKYWMKSYSINQAHIEIK